MNNTKSKYFNTNSKSTSNYSIPKNNFAIDTKSQNTRCTDLTSILYKRIIEIFPTSSKEIRKLLNDYPCETEIHFFTHQLLDKN